MKRMNFSGRTEQRRKDAEARAEARAARTDKQQLTRLNKMLGKGQGAVRERTRLMQRIAKAK